MPFDPSPWPHVASYLAQLPEGFDSYPDCLVHIDTFSLVRERYPSLVTLPGLPNSVVQVLTGSYQGDWLPEVHGNVIFLLLRDTQFKDDASFLAWAGDSAAQVFQKPWLRAVMAVMSPTLIILNIGKRWQTLHKGSTLTSVKAEKNGHQMGAAGALDYPPNLFDELLLRRIGKAFESVLAASRAKQPVTILNQFTRTRADYSMTWMD